MPKKAKTDRELLKPVGGAAGYEPVLGYGGPKVFREHVCIRCGGDKFDIIEMKSYPFRIIWTVKCRGCEREEGLTVVQK